jgi:starch phosphorylase
MRSNGESLRASLEQLALDLRWSWSRETDGVWERLDAPLWRLTHNPWLLVRSVGDDRLAELARERAFIDEVERCRRFQEMADALPTWFRERPRRLRLVAYFSMEFGLAEALPIYSGGLGVLAGDHLKAADGLGVPLIGIGLLYNQGYFRQVLDVQGGQRELYPPNEPDQLPLEPLWDGEGRRLRIPVTFPGRTVWARAWRAQVGRITLFLLDCNDALNSPADRGITAQLYGGSEEQRLQQELVLGIGGWRLVRKLGLDPDVCHLNEGHAAFAILERAHDVMTEHDVSFEVALRAARAGNVFTTHTAIEAAFDRFPASLAAKYLQPYADALSVDVGALLRLGRLETVVDDRFNMAYLALRGSGRVNGVSRLHAEVSRELLAPLFPGWPVRDVPVSHVTNGVHVPTWHSRYANALWARAAGDINGVGERELWTMRTRSRERLVDEVREGLARRLSAAGAAADRIAEARRALDPAALTLGFARRFTGYKRLTLLLHDPERLARLLTNRARPVQIVLAGKAHPRDDAGKAGIREWVRFAEREDVWDRVVFLSDYDLAVASLLVQGCDVWINTPRRPWEASGTSGMKVLVNGGINVSELDGWWAEAYAPHLGWAIRDEPGHPADADAREAAQLYAILENEIVPKFYERNGSGVPEAWVAMMRASMRELTPRFSADRMMREYVDEHYTSASASYDRRIADGAALAGELERELATLTQHWHEIHFVSRSVEPSGEDRRIEVVVALGAIDPALVRVELFADPVGVHPRECVRMHALGETPQGIRYSADVTGARDASDYTARVVPNVAQLNAPLECPLIRWQ